MRQIEIVKLQRAAFVEGILSERRLQLASVSPLVEASAAEEAAKLYPLPRQPRVIAIPGDEPAEYRINEGRLEYRCSPTDKWDEAWFTLERVRLLAELLDNPDEEVTS